VNTPDDQHAVFDFDFTHCFGHQAIVRSRNLTRLQRAPKGAGQSAGRRRDYVV
jgi:hypothetical protein